MRRVDVFFDFVSPYSYLGLAMLPAVAARHGVEWVPRPVVYAALLDATGLIGPAEIEVKRRYTFADIHRAAALAGLPLQGPPAHPFRSLEALRLVTAAPTDGAARSLALGLSDACWGRGLDLTSPAALRHEVERCGLDPDGLLAAVGRSETKSRLRATTDEAMQAGVFGVPTFRLEGELFWGHDRLSHLIARLEDRIPAPDAAASRLLDRPRGSDRSGRPADP